MNTIEITSDSLDDIAILPDELGVITERPTYTEICRKCGGTGTWVSYSGLTRRPCFACKGAGKFERKTSPESRAKARLNSVLKKAKTGDNNFSAFASEHSEIAAWMEKSQQTFPFAASLLDAVRKFGDLTEKQLSAAQNCIDKAKASATARAERIQNAQEVSVGKIVDSFDSAMENGIKRPKLRLGRFIFSRAPDSGKNAGALYVKEKETEKYLGKIAGGKFLPSRDCNSECENEVISAASNPEAAAVAYGIRTGTCACCGRPLTKGESIERGIGPVCATTFGW